MKTKNLLTLCCFLLTALSLTAQTPQLWGLTSAGGVNGPGTSTFGTILKVNGDGTAFSTPYTFNYSTPGTNAFGKLLDANGKFYGMASGNGQYGFGVIFSVNYDGSGYTVLHDFGNGTDGQSPNGSLIELSNGKLYGMTSAGGAFSVGGNGTSPGIVFSIKPDGSGYTILHSFNEQRMPYEGANPQGSLVQAPDGRLYGLTSSGGTAGTGTLFSIDSSTGSTFATMVNFDGGQAFPNTNGGFPNGSLIVYNSLLYGTCGGGNDFGANSDNGNGTIFSYSPGATSVTTIYDFDGSDGANPQGSLIALSNGKFYGLAEGGGANGYGVVFSILPDGTEYTDLNDFGSGSNGYYPVGDLVQDQVNGTGLLYGLTSSGDGGSGNGSGIIFQLDTTSSNPTPFTWLYDFNDTTENGPNGSLIQLSNGKLYGRAADAGQMSIYGLLFSYNPATSSFATVFNFSSNKGATPEASMIKATNGKLYGMTSNGGGAASESAGVIFSIDPSTLTYTDIYDFYNDIDHGINGSGNFPTGNLTQSTTDGKLYGVDAAGNYQNGFNMGDVFSINLDGTGYTDVYDFGTNNNDGSGPIGSLIQATNGLLYGMTGGGGNNGSGAIFSVDNSGNENVAVSFTGNTGSFPGNPSGSGFSNLIQASNGKLYGMTYSGGTNGKGVIFSVKLNGSGYAVLTNFNTGNNGYNPLGSLVEGANGKLYGMTSKGGSSSDGVIFSVDTTAGSPNYTLLVTFTGNSGASPGANPNGSLIQATDGTLYGMTSKGGTNGDGVIFSYTISGTYTAIRSLSASDGINPMGNLLQVSSPSNPTISANTPSPICSGGSGAALTASCSANCMGITYTWSPSTNLSATTGASVTANPTSTTTYTVTGTNGSGGTATATSVVTVNTPPTAPVATAGTGATNSQITANWNTVGGATGYFLDVSTGSGFGTFVTGYNNLNVGNVLTENVTGLSSGTTYFYRVRATNGTCTSTSSNTISYATTGSGVSCPFVGGAITTPFVIICNGSTTTLTDNGSTGNNYQWQISTDNTTWTDITGATSTGYTTASADGSTNKYYRLMSKSTACWNVTSNTAEVDISNPAITVTATNISDNTLTLNWSPAGSGNYLISYSGPTSGTLTSVTPPKTITGLSSDGTYNVTVTQTGVSGCSASGTTTAGTLCAIPTGVTLSSPAAGQIQVSWTGTPGADYRVYYRPLFSYNTYFTKDVSNVSSVLLTKQGGNNLYASTTYEVYVAQLNCPTTGATGQPTSPTNITTLPTVTCATPQIDSVRSLCPVQLEVFIHDNGVNQYNVYIQRLTPSVLAVNSYGVSGTYFTINTPYSGDQYLIAVDAKCGSSLSALYTYPGNVTVKPLCNAPANLILSNPICHGFTASWNADQCVSNSASQYTIYLRVSGTINYNSYGVPLPGGGIGPNKVINWLTPGRNYQAFVRTVYNCNGFVTYGPASQVETIGTLSSGCRDEEQTNEPAETKPAVQQYSADNQEVFSLYPNPNNGEFTVNLSRLRMEEDAVKIEVFNMLGQTIETHLTTISGGQMVESINLPNGASAGTYIVRLTAGKNIYTAKINVGK